MCIYVTFYKGGAVKLRCANDRAVEKRAELVACCYGVRLCGFGFILADFVLVCIWAFMFRLSCLDEIPYRPQNE